MSLVEKMWYKRAKFKHNPFELDSFKISDEIIGLENDVRELIYRIFSGSVIVIEGASGFGKTRLLKEVVTTFGGRGRIAYVDMRKLSKRLNIYDVLHSGLFRKKPKNMILLLDNAEEISHVNSERIKHYFDSNNLQSVVITTTDYNELKIPDSIRDRIGRNIIRLKEMSRNNAQKLIKNRLKNNKSFISEQLINHIIKTKNNPKHILIKCEHAYNYIIDEGLMEITQSKLDEILSGNIDSGSDIDLYLKCYVCGDMLHCVKHYWRCPQCDVYCKSCGVNLEEGDLACPECGEDVK